MGILMSKVLSMVEFLRDLTCVFPVFQSSEMGYNFFGYVKSIGTQEEQVIPFVLLFFLMLERVHCILLFMFKLLFLRW